MIRLVQVTWDKRAVFLERPNRFLALAQINGDTKVQKVHVRDPGRLKELLFPGNELLVKYAGKPGRKTSWDLMAAKFQGEWIPLNSGLHPAIARAILENPEISPFGAVCSITGEVKYGKSRLDFLIQTVNDEKIYIEVKGCTLMKGQTALFPDAPTARGRRHLQELMEIRKTGIRSAVVFLIFQGRSRAFQANRRTDPEFAKVLSEAAGNGVEIYPVLLEYRHDIIWYKSIIPVKI